MGRGRTRDRSGDFDRIVLGVDRRRDACRQRRSIEAALPPRGGASGETRRRRCGLIDVDAGGIQRYLARVVATVVGTVEGLVAGASEGRQPRAVDRDGRADGLEIGDQSLVEVLASERREALRVGLAVEVEIRVVRDCGRVDGLGGLGDGVREVERQRRRRAEQAHGRCRCLVLGCCPGRGIVERDRPGRQATIGAGTTPEGERRAGVVKREVAAGGADRDRTADAQRTRAGECVVVGRTVDRRVVGIGSPLPAAARHEDRVAGAECRRLHPETLGAAESRVVVEQEILGPVAATLEVGVAAIPAPVDGVVDDDVVGEAAARQRNHAASVSRSRVDGQRQPGLKRLHSQRRLRSPPDASPQPGRPLRFGASGVGGSKQLGDKRGHRRGVPGRRAGSAGKAGKAGKNAL